MEKSFPLKLSIIVPVYNVEEYLERCIVSLIEQDLPKSDYEIIVVNDGSTDNSYEIAKKLAQEHDNIVLVSQENKGLSGARNTGLRCVRGKYLLFVDSDDFFTPNSIGKLLEIAESNALELCFFQTVFERLGGVHDYGEGQKFDNFKVYNGEYLVLNGMHISSVWQNLYLSSFLFNTGISFYEGIIHEDIDFNYRLYPFAQRVMFTDLYCYHYCLYRESILRTKSPEKIKYLLESDFFVVSNILKETKTGYSKEIQALYRKECNSIIISNLIRILKEDNFTLGMKRECLATAKQKGVYPIVGKTKSWKTTILAHLLNIEWLLKCAIKLISLRQKR